MIDVAILFRTLQFLAHNGHSLTVPAARFADHAFFAELSAVYEDAYELLIARMLGLEGGIDLIELQCTAAAGLARRGERAKTPDALFRALLDGEYNACALMKTLMDDAEGAEGRWSRGAVEESEVRRFKLERRLEATI